MPKNCPINSFGNAKVYYETTRRNKRLAPEAWEDMKPDIACFMKEWGRDMEAWSDWSKMRFIVVMARHYRLYYCPAIEMIAAL